jgi:SAM-dependent methyltransferase
MTAYDAVRYPNHPHLQTHPDRLATLATLFGMSPAPVERCRVLEIGAGAGANIIPMAFGLPHSEFTGIDLAAGPVADGASMIERLGLTNIRLLAMDLMDVAEDFGEFDYIIAHGLYSWVPAEVRERILLLCRRHLAPPGVAFVSYNAYPGCHLRQMLREIMLIHTAGIEDPAERLREARAVLEMVREGHAEPGLKSEVENVLRLSDGALFHDDLAPVCQPFYFHEFAAAASRHGLQFLAEAAFHSMQPGSIATGPSRMLEALEPDVIRHQQYLDFLKLRRFRQSLLCRRDVALTRPPEANRVPALLASLGPHTVSGDPAGVLEFQGERGAKAQTSHPLAKAALIELGAVWPRRAQFPCLLARARERAASGAPEEHDATALAEILLYCYAMGLIGLHAHAPRFAERAGERPEASALARLQAHETPWITTLCHGLVRLDDEVGRRLVELLDGTRDRATLARELGVTSGLEQSLERLAKMPLLVA